MSFHGPCFVIALFLCTSLNPDKPDSNRALKLEKVATKITVSIAKTITVRFTGNDPEPNHRHKIQADWMAQTHRVWVASQQEAENVVSDEEKAWNGKKGGEIIVLGRVSDKTSCDYVTQTRCVWAIQRDDSYCLIDAKLNKVQVHLRV